MVGRDASTAPHPAATERCFADLRVATEATDGAQLNVDLSIELSPPWVAVQKSRRNFLIGGLAATGLSAGTWAWLKSRDLVELPSLSSEAPTPPEKPKALASAFDPRARETLTVLLGHLLPSQSPSQLLGAQEVQLEGYLETSCRIPGLRPVRNEILKLTRYLDLRCKKLHQKRFIEVPTDGQKELLQRIAHGLEPKKRFNPQAALEVCLRIALEGYLAHPFHGSNPNFKVWDSLKIVMPHNRDTHEGHHHG